MPHNKELVRNAMKKMCAGDMNAFDPLVARNYVCHDPVEGDLSLDGVKRMMSEWGEAFPEGEMELLEVIGDGDYVAARWRGRMKHTKAWRGTAPTGRWCTMEGIALYRFDNGKLVEEWDQFDALGLLRQIGAIDVELPAADRSRAATETQPQA